MFFEGIIIVGSRDKCENRAKVPPARLQARAVVGLDALDLGPDDSLLLPLEGGKKE